MQPGVAAKPERGAGRKAENVRQHVSRGIQTIDAKLGVLDPDVHVRPENQEPMGEILQLCLHAEIALFGRHLLIHPVRKRMRARRSNREAVLCRSFDDEAPQFGQLGAEFRDRRAHLRADLHLTLVQLGLGVSQHRPVARHQRIETGREITRHRIDDLIFLFDSYRQARPPHHASRPHRTATFAPANARPARSPQLRAIRWTRE